MEQNTLEIVIEILKNPAAYSLEKVLRAMNEINQYSSVKNTVSEGANIVH